MKTVWLVYKCRNCKRNLTVDSGYTLRPLEVLRLLSQHPENMVYAHYCTNRKAGTPTHGLANLIGAEEREVVEQ